jgi:major intracellular serine protease
MSDNLVTLPPYKIEPNAVVGILSEQENINFRLSNILEMWKQTEGKGCRVAVLDTGCPRQHEDLKIAAALNFTDDDGYDNQGHSTHVCGIIGATSKNGIGIKGIASQADICAVKVLNDRGQGRSEWIAEGIKQAVDVLDVHVINLSLGGGAHTDDWSDIKQSIKYAEGNGIIVIAAAGNDGDNALAQPARYSTIAVGSLGEFGEKRASYSNHAKNMYMASGTKIKSTWLGNSYNTLSGTSMAAPVISGIVSLLVSDILSDHKRDTGIDMDRKYIYDNVKTRLDKMAYDIGAPGADKETGIGIFKFQDHEEEEEVIADDSPAKTCECMKILQAHIDRHDLEVIEVFKNLLTNAGTVALQNTTGGKLCTCCNNPGGMCQCL